MANPRKTVPDLNFNGKNVNTELEDYLKSVEYTDVASGESDSIKIKLQNISLRWLNGWYPVKGDKIGAYLQFQNWDREGDNFKLQCGEFVLDEISFSGGPREASIGGLAIPANDSFKTTERTKTWSNVTIKQIGTEVAKKYGLGFSYDADQIKITSIEQSEKSDSAFLYDVCETYGLAMKVYRNKIIIFDKGKYEKKNAVATLRPEDFVDEDWEYLDTLEGTYTGARISYKSGSDNKELSMYVGLKKENAAGSRVLKINEQASDINDAGYKAAAKVNLSNEQATTITGPIFFNRKIVAGVTVTLEGFGKGSGKYYVDKVTIDTSSNGTKMNVELHKVQTRLTYVPVVIAAPAAPKKKEYKKGDIVHFKGGTHYVSSYPGSKGYRVSAGTAKITIVNGSGKAHPWHLITENWSQTHVYGWVDDGTFE